MNTSDYQATEEEEILAIDHELKQIDLKITKLKDRKEILITRRSKLKDCIDKKKSEKLASKNWSSEGFSWSKKVKQTLVEKFKIPEFRPLQLETINATMSKEDVILIMPTGGGKSLCYQLPALVDNGITIVVSPLVSLMEDQLMGLKRLGVPAVFMSANSTKEDTKQIMTALQDKSSSIKLIYVTPEKLAKSKRFMSQLQKCSEQGRFSRLAIDEVHCCSTWGHDFRPDYKFLGVFKGMFPDTPILGLTATSTSKVTLDVQQMLTIQGCLVLKDSFNRPNLNYKVLTKPQTQNECIDLLEKLLNKYKNKSGIIYTTTIKECEELVKELRNRNMKAGIYHAMLESTTRSKMHEKWMSGEYQVIVGTIAFGLGIDKPDVRFVIHHCLSKSMESFYQESGRAGRDGKTADCIVLYRLADVFKLSTMVFTQQTGLDCLYNMVRYCLNPSDCRRSLIAQHFDEVWTSQQCNTMCDHCQSACPVKQLNIQLHCRDLYKILHRAASQDVKMTSQKLLDAWFNKGDVKLRHSDVRQPSITRQLAETVVAYLLLDGYLKEDFHFTPYSTISYIKRGPRASLVDQPDSDILITLPCLDSEVTTSDDVARSVTKTTKKRRYFECDGSNDKGEN